MPEISSEKSSNLIVQLVTVLLGLPWPEIIGELWKTGRKVMRGLSNEGIYEVLEYDSTLELKDRRGEKALFQKREKIKYLQDYIIAYQDQAWGDGDILVNYRCSPGVPVDRYRCGYKTHILISLREPKNRNETDEFKIEWEINKGFLVKNGFWATEISHKTRRANIQIVFPENRPPLRAFMVEKNRQQTRVLEKDAIVQLPDKRWMIRWEQNQPKLFEQYILNWEW